MSEYTGWRMQRRFRALGTFCSASATVAALWFLATCSLMGQTQPETAATPARSSASEAWMSLPPTSTGLDVGKKIPSFQLRDQNGKLQDFNSIRGPKGAALYFMRSADW